jgi:hypothetical protein
MENLDHVLTMKSSHLSSGLGSVPLIAVCLLPEVVFRALKGTPDLRGTVRKHLWRWEERTQAEDLLPKALARTGDCQM